jgi:hypothetical protein
MFFVSAATGEGCRDLMVAVHRHLSERSRPAHAVDVDGQGAAGTRESP